MVFGDWFKGSKDKKKPAPPAIRRPDEFVTVYDERGRELQIKRADWVPQVLAPAIEKAWNDPAQLRAQIVQALRDEFPEHVLAAADRLVELDHESEDALVIAAAAWLATDNADAADRFLQRALAKHGPTGIILTNVAKVQEQRGAKREARVTLRRALELDPNQEMALGWWAADAHQAGGDAEYLAALEAIAVLPNAWRPQLWLGRVKLKMGDRAGALALYDQVLARSGDAGDALMMVTGDLGNAGALEDIVRIAVPRYTPEAHGPAAGMNLARAFMQLGRIDDARAVVRRMQAMGWAPLAATLAALDAEIMNAAPQTDPGPAPEVGAMAFDSPIWTRGLWEPDWLWREPAADEPTITLPSFANELATATGVRKTDDMGRLTRALPIYLEEALRVRFRLRARAALWIAKGYGPAVSSRQLDRAVLESAAPESAARRIIVAGSLVASGVNLQIWEIGGDAPVDVPIAVALNDPAAVAAAVESALVGALKQRGVLWDAPPPPFYRAPTPDLLGAYVLCLEQLLYQLIVANDLLPAASLWNERGFFESYFGLVEAWPNAPESARLLAICGTLAAATYKSALVEPYRKIVLQWVDEAAPGSPVQKLAPAIFKRLGEDTRYQLWLRRAPALGDARYMAWLERVKAGS
jgi:pentatricopeptide repeat protein